MMVFVLSSEWASLPGAQHLAVLFRGALPPIAAIPSARVERAPPQLHSRPNVLNY